MEKIGLGMLLAIVAGGAGTVAMVITLVVERHQVAWSNYQGSRALTRGARGRWWHAFGNLLALIVALALVMGCAYLYQTGR